MLPKIDFTQLSHTELVALFGQCVADLCRRYNEDNPQHVADMVIEGILMGAYNR